MLKAFWSQKSDNNDSSTSYKKQIIDSLWWVTTRLVTNAHDFLIGIYNIVMRDQRLLGVKRRLALTYTSFDQADVMMQIDAAYHLDASFHLSMPEVIRYVARKQGLSDDKLEILCRDLMREDLSLTLKITLCQIVKYSVQHGSFINISDLVHLLEEIKEEKMNHELIWAMAYVMQQQRIIQLDDDIAQKLVILLQEVDHPAKSMLALPEVMTSSAMPVSISNSVFNNKRKLENRLIRRMPKTEISKQLYTTKTTHENFEEEQVNLDGLLEALKVKTKRKKIQRQNEQIPMVVENGGSDQSILRNTYQEVESFYYLAEKHKKLKDDDKDKYLPTKFLHHDVKWHIGYTVGNFFIDRMICKIFFIISKNQSFNKETLSQLMQCINSIEELKLKIFGTKNNLLIAPSMINEDICRGNYQGSSDLIRSIAQRLSGSLTDLNVGLVKSSYIVHIDNIMAIIDTELENMRSEAIAAIYHAVLRNKAILSQLDIEHVNHCLTDENQALKKTAIKILGALGNADEVNYTSLFDAYLTQLEGTINEQEAEEALCYISRQLHDQSRCKALFDSVVVLKMTRCICNQHLNNIHRLWLLDIINDYLQKENVSSLCEKQWQYLKECMQKITDEKTHEAILKIILLNTCKTKRLPSDVFTQLASMKLAENGSNLVVMIIEQMENKSIVEANFIAPKLQSNDVIMQDEEGIHFVLRHQSNKNLSTISRLTAKIIVDIVSLECSQVLSCETVQYLIDVVLNNDKQARILAAKALFLACKNNLIKEEVNSELLFELQPITKDFVPDISAYITFFYVVTIFQLAQSEMPLPRIHLDFLYKIHVDDEFNLGEMNFTQTIHQYILAIVNREVSKNQQITNNTFNLFEQLWLKNNGCENEFSTEWITILTQHVIINKNRIPESTFKALENYLSISQYANSVLLILIEVIKNGQYLSEKTSIGLKEVLFHSKDASLRKTVFECLQAADAHQDLSEPLFNLLEIERAANSILCGLSDQSAALITLERMAEKGQNLTVTACVALMCDSVPDEKIVSVLKHLVIHEYGLNNQLIQWLEEKFSLLTISSTLLMELISIFYYLVKNNQKLSRAIILKLETLFDFDAMISAIRPILFMLRKKGEILSSAVNDNMDAFSQRIKNLPDEPLGIDQNSEHNLLSSDDVEWVNAISLASFMKEVASEEYSEYRDFIISDWLEELEVCSSESFEFYQQWLTLEKKSKNPHLILKFLNGLCIDSFEELSGMMDFIPFLDEEISQCILKSEEVNNSLLRMSWLKSLQIVRLSKLLSFSNLKWHNKLNITLDKLLTIGWKASELSDFIRVSNISNTMNLKVKHLVEVFYLLAQHQFSSKYYRKIKKILETEEPIDWLKQVNHYVISHHFSLSPMIKSPTELMSELLLDNKNSVWVHELRDEVLLANLESVYNNQQLAAHWKKEDVFQWANNVKNNPDYFLASAHLVEALIVIKQAYFLLTGFQLTSTQILACLVGLKSKKNLGRLLQVQTGEGKTVRHRQELIC